MKIRKDHELLYDSKLIKIEIINIKCNIIDDITGYRFLFIRIWNLSGLCVYDLKNDLYHFGWPGYYWKIQVK